MKNDVSVHNYFVLMSPPLLLSCPVDFVVVFIPSFVHLIIRMNKERRDRKNDKHDPTDQSHSSHGYPLRDHSPANHS